MHQAREPDFPILLKMMLWRWWKKESGEESPLLWWHMLLWTNLWAILDGISGPSRLDNSNLGLGVVGNGLKAFNNTSGRRFQKEPAHMEFNSRKGLVYWWYLFCLWQKTQPNEKKFYKKCSVVLWLQARMRTGSDDVKRTSDSCFHVFMFKPRLPGRVCS